MQSECPYSPLSPSLSPSSFSQCPFPDKTPFAVQWTLFYDQVMLWYVPTRSTDWTCSCLLFIVVGFMMVTLFLNEFYIKQFCVPQHRSSVLNTLYSVVETKIVSAIKSNNYVIGLSNCYNITKWALAGYSPRNTRTHCETYTRYRVFHSRDRYE